MTDVVILGAGGFAREAYGVFVDDNRNKRKWNVLGFIDDNPEQHGRMLCDLPVLGGFDWLRAKRRRKLQALCAVGAPRTRKLLVDRATGMGIEFCTVVHPAAHVSRWVEIGPGTIITGGSILTTQIKIGSHVLLNLNCTVGHDTVIGPFCTMNPGCNISGCVRLGEGVDMGTGAVIIQGKSIGDWSVIGAGAVVTDNIPSHVTAVGVPCKVIKQHAVA